MVFLMYAPDLLLVTKTKNFAILFCLNASSNFSSISSPASANISPVSMLKISAARYLP